MYFPTGQVIFVSKWPNEEFVSLYWLHSVWQNHYLVKLLSYSGMLNYKKVFQDVQGRLCADSNSKKLDPKFLFGRPSHASGCPLVSRSRIVQGSIHPDVMATRPDALQSLRRLQPYFTNTEWEDNLHPSGRLGNTVWTRSCYGNYVQSKWNSPNYRAAPSGPGLNMEKA